jgi:hypothetical protein
MSWGYRITILILTFVCLMTGLVIAAFRQDFDLVTEDYYGRELQFQSQIEKQKNHQQLSSSILCTQNKDQLILQFPEELRTKSIEGNILLYRPSNAKKDFTVSLRPVSGEQIIAKEQLTKGLYKIQINYTCEGTAYYFEEDLMID